MESISIRVDERIELLSVLAHLSTYDGRLRAFFKAGPLPPTNPLYKRIVRHFGAFSGAEAVHLFDRITRNPHFMCDAPVKLFLSLDRGGTDLIDGELLDRCGDAALLRDLRAAIPEFREESRFREYFLANADDYSPPEREVALWLADADPVGSLEAYLGLSNSNYRLILAPLLIGNYGARFGDRGAREACAVVTPVDDAGASFGNGNHVLGIVWHEFLHSFINDITESFFTDGGSLSRIAVDEKMRDQAYPEAKTVIDENVIRAIVVRLFTAAGKQDHARRLLEDERERGFIYVPPLIDRLREYEANRDAYGTIADFYPRIMASFN